jgi:hypothetical protein
MLIVTSVPPVIIGWIMTAVSCSPKFSWSERKARQMSSALCRPGTTAPASLVRGRPGTSALSATGPVNRSAAAIAVASVVTAIPAASGTP